MGYRLKALGPGLAPRDLQGATAQAIPYRMGEGLAPGGPTLQRSSPTDPQQTRQGLLQSLQVS
jgi:hypothetical protein